MQDFKSGEKRILIAGGSGLVGRALSDLLSKDGHQVKILSRSKNQNSANVFYWNPLDKVIDPKAIPDVDVLINLAGLPIAGKRWTKRQRQDLYVSRIASSDLLFNTVAKMEKLPDCYIGASAVGIYGHQSEKVNEKFAIGSSSDFLVSLCTAWEDAHKQFDSIGVRTMILRIGLVLSNDGGILPEFRKLAVGRIGFTFGKGGQFMPWIHIDDLTRLIKHLIFNVNTSALVNGVSPAPVTSKKFMTALVTDGGSKDSASIIPVPASLIKAVLGEMSQLMLEGQYVHPEFATESGFQFDFNSIEEALSNLAKRR